MNDLLISTRFPRASHYHPDWIRSSVSGGANSLWLAEWLTSAMDLRAGMRILDLGCGRGASSVFLHNEFGVQVWATDLWFPADERLQRVRDAGVEDAVVPIHADARSLPFAADFFDAIVSIDSFPYYGTDDLYLNYLARFVKPGGQIGIAGAGLVDEVPRPVPAHLTAWWEPSMACLHTAEWWRRHWERPSLVDVVLADTMPDGWQLWRDWQRAVAPDNSVEIDTITADAGRYLGYVRALARRRSDVEPDPPITTVPVSYSRHPVLRG
ncbi:MAG TPA: class I SAM-dependent methyltransferase [Aldersonia sp.]